MESDRDPRQEPRTIYVCRESGHGGAPGCSVPRDKPGLCPGCARELIATRERPVRD